MEDLYNPYNDKNSEISKENIKQLFESFNIFYNINNLDLFKRAFIHRSQGIYLLIRKNNRV